MLAVDLTEAVTARTGTARWFYDWQGLLGVLAAFVLVGVTIIYVLLTRTMSRAATDNIKLAREAVQQAKDNVELAREAVQQARDNVELTRECGKQKRTLR